MADDPRTGPLWKILKNILRRTRVPRTILKQILWIIQGMTTILKTILKKYSSRVFPARTDRRGVEMDANHIGAWIVKGFGHLHDGPPPDPFPPPSYIFWVLDGPLRFIKPCNLRYLVTCGSKSRRKIAIWAKNWPICREWCRFLLRVTLWGPRRSGPG